MPSNNFASLDRHPEILLDWLKMSNVNHPQLLCSKAEIIKSDFSNGDLPERDE